MAKTQKTSEKSIYVGRRHVQKVEKIAVNLTKNTGKPVSTPEAARYIIDQFCLNYSYEKAT